MAAEQPLQSPRHPEPISPLFSTAPLLPLRWQTLVCLCLSRVLESHRGAGLCWACPHSMGALGRAGATAPGGAPSKWLPPLISVGLQGCVC